MPHIEEKIKKNLLIFFGEFRTFNYVIPLLKKLDQVDIIVSTWTESNTRGEVVQINEDKIYQLHPNIKKCNVIDFKQIDNFESKNNAWKMYYHWKSAINSIQNTNEYDNVIVHRTDLLSNWHTILDLNIEEDILYFHYGDYSKPHFPGPDEPDVFWVNDYYFFGKFDVVKKFINLFNKEINTSPHYDMWEVIYKNNFQIKKYILRACLVRDSDIETINNSNLNVELIGKLIGPGSPVDSGSPVDRSPYSNQNN